MQITSLTWIRHSIGAFLSTLLWKYYYYRCHDIKKKKDIFFHVAKIMRFAHMSSRIDRSISSSVNRPLLIQRRISAMHFVTLGNLYSLPPSRLPTVYLTHNFAVSYYRKNFLRNRIMPHLMERKFFSWHSNA